VQTHKNHAQVTPTCLQCIAKEFSGVIHEAQSRCTRQCRNMHGEPRMANDAPPPSVRHSAAAHWKQRLPIRPGHATSTQSPWTPTGAVTRKGEASQKAAIPEAATPTAGFTLQQQPRYIPPALQNLQACAAIEPMVTQPDVKPVCPTAVTHCHDVRQ
jgi:hypothetical protein